MSQIVIEQPVINSPFQEPSRHFMFGDHGIHDSQRKSLAERFGVAVERADIGVLLLLLSLFWQPIAARENLRSSRGPLVGILFRGRFRIFR